MHYHLNHISTSLLWHLTRYLESNLLLTCAKFSSFFFLCFTHLFFRRKRVLSTRRIYIRAQRGGKELFNSAMVSYYPLLLFTSTLQPKVFFRMIVLLFSSATKKIMRILIHQAYLSDPKFTFGFLFTSINLDLFWSLLTMHKEQITFYSSTPSLLYQPKGKPSLPPSHDHTSPPSPPTPQQRNDDN